MLTPTPRECFTCSPDDGQVDWINYKFSHENYLTFYQDCPLLTFIPASVPLVHHTSCTDVLLAPELSAFFPLHGIGRCYPLLTGVSPSSRGFLPLILEVSLNINFFQDLGKSSRFPASPLYSSLMFLCVLLSLLVICIYLLAFVCFSY